jgi:hypothetical protein
MKADSLVDEKAVYSADSLVEPSAVLLVAHLAVSLVRCWAAHLVVKKAVGLVDEKVAVMAEMKAEK